MKRNIVLILLLAAAACPFAGCPRTHKKIYALYTTTQLTVQNPAGTVFSGDMQISFTISATWYHKTDMAIYYSAGYGWIPATIKSASAGSIENNLIKQLDVPPVNPFTGENTPATYTFTWDTIADLGYEYVPNVQLKMVTEEPDDYYNWPYVFYGDSIWTKTFIVNNNRKPIISVTTPAANASGDAMIEFTLTDPDNDICRVTVEYSKDGGAHYFAATLRDVTSYPVSANVIFGLDQTATLRQYVFVWGTDDDMPLKYDEEMRIKLVANDGLINSDPSETGNFTVANNLAPVCTIQDVGGTQTGDVTLNFTVKDEDSSAATLTFKYSIDGGATWRDAAIKYSSVGALADNAITVTGVSATPLAGYAVWNSLGDGVATENLETNVRVSIQAADDQRQGQSVSTRSFIVDNTLAGSWGSAQLISGALNASSPACALDPSDKAVVVFCAPDNAAISQIYIVLHNGLIWSATAQITSSATGATKPRVAVTDDYCIHVVYVEGSAVKYTRYSGAWSAPVKISGAGAAGEPDITKNDTDPNDAHVVWKEFTAGQYEIYYSYITSGTPGAPKLVSDTSEDSESPAVACYNGVPYVVWSDVSSGNWEILSAADTAGWTHLGIVSNTAGISRKPRIAADPSSGNVAAAWMDDEPGANFDIFINIYNGSNWGNAVNVSANAGNSVNPDVSYRGGAPRLVWSDNTNAAMNYEIAYSSFLSGAGTRAVLLSNTVGESNTPALACGWTGKQVLVWQEVAATGTQIFARLR